MKKIIIGTIALVVIGGSTFLLSKRGHEGVVSDSAPESRISTAVNESEKKGAPAPEIEALIKAIVSTDGSSYSMDSLVRQLEVRLDVDDIPGVLKLVKGQEDQGPARAILKVCIDESPLMTMQACIDVNGEGGKSKAQFVINDLMSGKESAVVNELARPGSAMAIRSEVVQVATDRWRLDIAKSLLAVSVCISKMLELGRPGYDSALALFAESMSNEAMSHKAGDIFEFVSVLFTKEPQRVDEFFVFAKKKSEDNKVLLVSLGDAEKSWFRNGAKK